MPHLGKRRVSGPFSINDMLRPTMTHKDEFQSSFQTLIGDEFFAPNKRTWYVNERAKERRGPGGN